MRNFILLLLFCSLLSCNQTPNYDSDLETLNKKIETELKSGVKKDSILLGLKLGMSKEEFEAQLWKSAEEGLINPDERGFFKIKIDKEEFVIFGRFYQFELCQVALVLDNAENSSTYYSSSNLKSNLSVDYSKKYGDYIRMKTDSYQEYDRNYFWINGNRMISITDGEEEFDNLPVIKYYDIVKDSLRTDRIKKDIETQEWNERLQQRKQEEKINNAL